MRIYNNYDGYMYTIKELKIGVIEFKGIKYNLDENEESVRLLDKFIEIGALHSIEVSIHDVKETQYNFVEQCLPKPFVDLQLHKQRLQRKPTLLNIKLLVSESDDVETRLR